MSLCPFLQRRLRIAHVFAERCEGILPVTLDEILRCFHAAIEVKRGQYRLAGAGENNGLAPPAAIRLRMSKDQMIRQTSGLSGCGAGFLSYQRIQLQRERAFWVGGIKVIKPFRDDEPQNAIAQEFEALVRHLSAGARVCQRPLDQSLVGEGVAEELFDRAEVALSR